METNDFHFQESTNVWKLWECQEFLQVRTVIVGSKIDYHSPCRPLLSEFVGDNFKEVRDPILEN